MKPYLNHYNKCELVDIAATKFLKIYKSKSEIALLTNYAIKYFVLMNLNSLISGINSNKNQFKLSSDDWSALNVTDEYQVLISWSNDSFQKKKQEFAAINHQIADFHGEKDLMYADCIKEFLKQNYSKTQYSDIKKAYRKVLLI